MRHLSRVHWIAIVVSIALCLAIAAPGNSVAQGKGGGSGGNPNPEMAGNNLSFPVLWAEGVTKALRGTPVVYSLSGEWWYWWGTDPVDDEPLSCSPDPEDPNFCEDGDTDPATDPFEEPGTGDVKVYLQQDLDNEWQAESADMSAAPLHVDWIDWGDNLEAVDWYTRSQVRTEVVLYQDLEDLDPPMAPMTQYEMKHLYGLGIDEMHGTTGTVLDGLQATIYSPCARLTIQKLLVDREVLADDPSLLTWVPEEGWLGSASVIINNPIFNMAVHDAADGPGYYNAEINVKGKIIFGYTWNVRRLNEGAGDYRITFSFDQVCDTVNLNTFFTPGVTEIILPEEEEESTLVASDDEGGESPVGGATAMLDTLNNLTYIDVRITERSGGGKGKKK